RARLGDSEVLGDHRRLARVRRVRVPHPSSSARRSGTRSGVTDSRKLSLIITGVAQPQAPRHSTSITVNRPSGEVAPGSPQPVCSRNALATSAAPQTGHGVVVHTCTKCLPTGCWWYIV